MLSVFFIWCFCVWLGVFCRFFAFFLSKGRFFFKISGANFCFWVSVLVVCVFGAVLPMFLHYYSVFRSRNCL